MSSNRHIRPYTVFLFSLFVAIFIVSLGLFEMYEDDPQTEVSRSIEPVYDGAGRLVFDGEYVYQYDHWGRLVQINEADPDPLNPPTDPEDVILSAMGPMLKHYVYDGLGRLIRTTAPVPDADTSTGATRAVHFYYDGARRIQEIQAKDVLNYQAAQGSGDPGLESLASGSTDEPNPDGSNTPMALQSGQLDPIPHSRNIHREYVWGPGDWGFDEILLQTDEFDDEYWCIQDGGGDLVALVTVVGPLVEVVRQWTYDAYGAVLTAEHMGSALESHIGHKGLFVERLDVGVGDATDPESPSLVPYAHAIYHNRNRTYAPMHGRFLQPDPNQTAMSLLAVTASHGRGFGAITIAFNMEGMYGDGLNLYQYLGSNPWTHSDPLGLSYDPFDIVDEFLAERAGSAAALLDRLGQSAKAAAVVAATMAAYLPVPAVAILGDLALAALNGEEIDQDRILRAIGMSIIPGSRHLRLLQLQSGRIFTSTATTSAQYALSGGSRAATKGGTYAATRAGTVTGRFLTWLNKGPKIYKVYYGIRREKRVYVGMTKQSEEARRRQHNLLGKRFSRLEVIFRNLSRNQARSIEQAIILSNSSLENKINSISPSRDIYAGAVAWGRTIAGI